MNIVETLRLEMFQRVRQFESNRPEPFPASSHVAELFGRVARAITEIEAGAAAQVSGFGAAREKTATKTFLRGNLEEAVEAVHRTARAISIQIPGVIDRFPLPPANSDQALVTTARAYAKDVAPLKAEFTKRGLAATFVEDLDRTRSEFEESISQTHTSRETHVSATAAMDEPFEDGMEAVQELKLIMPNLLKGDPPTLAAWTSASHVERHSTRKEAKGATVGASPGPNNNPAPEPGKATDIHA